MRDLTGWDGVGEPPAGMAMGDPDLKALTAAFSPSFASTQITVDIIYSGEGRIRLWTDQTKTTEIADGGALPDYPECTFYVEGLVTSSGENDVTVRASVPVETPQGTSIYTVTKSLTVTPMLTNMEVRPSNPNTVTLLRDPTGRVSGLNSGEQFPAIGGAPDSLRPGATFDARVWRPGVFGDAGFVQNVTDMVQATGPAITLTNYAAYSHILRSATYPILDYVADAGAPAPLYPSVADNTLQDEQRIFSKDTPTVGSLEFGDLIASVDMTFQARLYTVWKFTDESIYTLGVENWQVAFEASRVNGVLTPAAGAIVTADPSARSHADPGTTAYPPSYNDSNTFTPYG